MTDKSDDRVGHLNTILARGGGNLNDPIFKWGKGGMLKFRVDRRITSQLTLQADFASEAFGTRLCVFVTE